MYALDPQLQQDTVRLGQFSLCDVLLMKDAQYPWVILVPRRSSIREAFHLSSEDRHLLTDESAYVSQRMSDFFEADSMNVAALGNVVSQLHIHHVVRKHEDPAWPKPVWGHLPPKLYTEIELNAQVEALTRLFSDRFVASSDSENEDSLY